MSEKCEVIKSQRAWVGHGAMHGDVRVNGELRYDDAPPRWLAPALPTWEGEPFEEDTKTGDDWLYDDPSLRRVPAEDGDAVFDSRDGVPS
jgi:hypothetical protein